MTLADGSRTASGCIRRRSSSGSTASRAVRSGSALAFDVPGDHRRRHQRQGLDLRDARSDRARRRLPGRPLLSRTSCTSTSAAGSTARCVDARALLPHFEAVEAARGEVALTYFEFTLAGDRSAARCDARSTCVILEVGLGGRLDAVNVFDADCASSPASTSTTSNYLGADREIDRPREGRHPARRPARRSSATRCRRAASSTRPRAVGADLRAGRPRLPLLRRPPAVELGRARHALQRPGLSGAARRQPAAQRGGRAGRARSAARAPAGQRAGRAHGLATVELPGRFQVVAGQPAVVLDVAHNPHAVAALAQNLDQMGFFPRTHAVFGAMRDKDIDASSRAWRRSSTPGTSPTCRGARGERGRARRAPGRRRPARAARVTSATHADARRALAAALGAADPADRIVVFGSFHTVGGVLEHGLPQRAGRHAA